MVLIKSMFGASNFYAGGVLKNKNKAIFQLLSYNKRNFCFSQYGKKNRKWYIETEFLPDNDNWKRDFLKQG